MRIWSDFHHSGLLRSIFYLFCDRLGHTLDIPSASFVDTHTNDGIWGVIHKTFPKSMGGIDTSTWDKTIQFVSADQFLDTDYDMVLITRTETEPIIYPMLDKKYRFSWRKNRPKIVGWSGNENTIYNWEKLHNLIATDWQTYWLSPDNIHKIWTGQELGRHYGETFSSITESNLHNINSFINNLNGFDHPFRWNADAYNGYCPHCNSQQVVSARTVNVWGLWCNCIKQLPEYVFTPYGAGNRAYGGDNIEESKLPAKYGEGVLTWHFKNFEGWGHSLLQSIACGRPVLVPKGFYKYRTANKYLIPYVTCFECDWDPVSICEMIKEVTKDVETANSYASMCYETGKTLFGSWHIEAERVASWLDDLHT